MPDREKVLKALRCLSNPFDEERDCDNCSYDFCSCVLDVTADALELLKAQQKTPVVFKQYDYGIIDSECGNCGLFLDKTYSVCPRCGKGLNWNA